MREFSQFHFNTITSVLAMCETRLSFGVVDGDREPQGRPRETSDASLIDFYC